MGFRLRLNRIHLDSHICFCIRFVVTLYAPQTLENIPIHFGKKGCGKKKKPKTIMCLFWKCHLLTDPLQSSWEAQGILKPHSENQCPKAILFNAFSRESYHQRLLLHAPDYRL